MRRPRILLTSDLGTVGKKRRLSSTVGMGYVRSVEAAGGIPLILPPLITGEEMKAIFAVVDGVICIGGPDYRRGGMHPRCSYVYPQREDHDFRLFSSLLETDIPILGICLGMQLMSISTGGDMHTHLPDSFMSSMDHVHVSHEVALVRDSHMISTLGARFMVNSSHHQALRTVGRGFVETAHASDGVIEMIEWTGDIFRLGVQWHPERMPDSSVQKKLFSLFVWSTGNRGQWP